MNEDTISRQAAIDGFYEMASDTDHLCTVSDYVSFLESLPLVQEWLEHGTLTADIIDFVPEQRWIPVSKKKPNGEELVNVSCHDTSGDTSFDYTSSGWITTNGEYWIVDNEINSYVVAWMPLPEPYKEEK